MVPKRIYPLDQGKNILHLPGRSFVGHCYMGKQTKIRWNCCGVRENFLALVRHLELLVFVRHLIEFNCSCSSDIFKIRQNV